MQALTAEVVLGARLVVRHRSFRFAVALALALLAAAATSDSVTVERHAVFVVAGTLGAASGIRLTAPGAALSAIRRAAADWWVPPVGRLLGALAVTAPIVFLGGVTLVSRGSDWRAPAGAVLVALLFLAVWIVVSSAAAPLAGEAGAGAIALLLVWFGGLAPSAVHQLLNGSVYLQRPAVLLWNTLPLGWRVDQAVDGSLVDLLVLCSWLVTGVLVGAWAVDWVFVRGVRGADCL
jgi:hypothetical protein